MYKYKADFNERKLNLQKKPDLAQWSMHLSLFHSILSLTRLQIQHLQFF